MHLVDMAGTNVTLVKRGGVKKLKTISSRPTTNKKSVKPWVNLDRKRVLIR